MREEKGEKVEERWKAWEPKEPKPSQTGSQPPQIQEAKKVAVVNWWKACSTGGAKARTKETPSDQELAETRAKLQKAEKTISDMREQVSHLQASLLSAQESVAKQENTSGAAHIDQSTNTEAGEAGRAVRDAAVATEGTGGVATQPEHKQLLVSADGLLASLRKMEAMVSGALETAELVRESEQRVGRVRARMESITQRVEEALERTATTELQLCDLEARITQQPAPAQVCVC